MYRKTNSIITIIVGASILLSACSAAPTAQPSADVVVEQFAPTTAPMAAPTDAPVVSEVTNPIPNTGGVMLPEVDPAALSGKIVSAGSSTVFPLAEAMAERFKNEGFTGEITIDSIGSGAGFERFCKAGETDVSNASRKIKDTEVANCAAIGRTPIQFRIGTDAIAMVVSSQNDFLKDVTLAELGKIYSSKVTKWSDVRPEWPNEDILRFSPGTDSGTFDYFVEVALGPNFKNEAGTPDLAAAKTDLLNNANIQFSEDDNVLVQGVEGSKYAVGYFGFAYYTENKDKLNAISIDGVTPSFTTAEDNTYKLSRPLFLYSDAQILKSKPQVAGYINFFLTYVNDEIQNIGYFPASQAALDEARQSLLDALK